MWTPALGRLEEVMKKILLVVCLMVVTFSHSFAVEKAKVKKITSLDFDIELYSKNDSNDYFLSQMKDDIKFYDEHSINYLYYSPFDEESWKNSDEKYKVLSLIISIFTIH